MVMVDRRAHIDWLVFMVAVLKRFCMFSVRDGCLSEKPSRAQPPIENPIPPPFPPAAKWIQQDEPDNSTWRHVVPIGNPAITIAGV